MSRDADQHRVLRELRAHMPPPARKTYAPEYVARLVVDAVERRAPAVYVPGWLRSVQAVRAGLPWTGLAADPPRADAIVLRSEGAAGVRRTRSRGNPTIARLKPGLPLAATRLHPTALTARRRGDGPRPRQSISRCLAVRGSSPARTGARLVGYVALPWRPVRAWPDPAIGWPDPGGSARRRVSFPPGRSDLALRESARF